jgi:hypothetical protein
MRAETKNLADGIRLKLRQGTLTERGRLSTVDLLVLTSLDQLIYILKILFRFIENKLY